MVSLAHKDLSTWNIKISQKVQKKFKFHQKSAKTRVMKILITIPFNPRKYAATY